MRLNQEELRVVYVCVELVNQIFDEAAPAGIGGILQKMGAGLASEEKEVCEQMVDRLLWLEEEDEAVEVDLTEDPVILGELERAVDDHLILELRYNNPITGEERQFKFRPQQFLTVRGVRYIGGHCFGSPSPEQILRISWINEVVQRLDLQVLPGPSPLPTPDLSARTG